MTYFLTFTCNMNTHFGTKVNKNWIDGDEQKNKIPNFNDLNDKDKEEYTTVMNYALAQLLLRVQ